MSTTDQSSITTVAEDITTALQSSDQQSASSLQTLSLVHQARISQVTRYSAAVAAHFGAGSAEATAAQAALTASQAVAVRSDIVNRQLSMAVPTVPAGGWVLYGSVQDATGAPVAAQTVFFANAQGTFESEYGYAYTDDTGSYSIAVEARPRRRRRRRRRPRGTSRPRPRVRPSSISRSPTRSASGSTSVRLRSSRRPARRRI